MAFSFKFINMKLKAVLAFLDTYLNTLTKRLVAFGPNYTHMFFSGCFDYCTCKYLHKKGGLFPVPALPAI